MKAKMHKAVTTEAVRLLPKGAQSFFDDHFKDGTPYMDKIREGAKEEDNIVDLKTYPINHEAINIGNVIADIEAGLISILPFIGTDDIRKMLNGEWPDNEHFWNHDFGETGLINPLGLTASWRCAPARAEDHWASMPLQNWQDADDDEKKEILFTLGRVVHLLEDMGTPVHVHGDAHPAAGGFIYDDDYEDYIEAQITKEEEPNTLPEKWRSDRNRDLLFYDPGWSLKDHYLQMAKIAVLYDSDDTDGLGSGKPYRWDSIFESFDAHRDVTLDLTDYACEAIARDLVPLNTSFVSGLYIRFLHAIGKEVPGLYVIRLTVDELQVLDDTDPWGSGEIFIDVRIGPENKRVSRLGQYDLDDGERTRIGGTYSFILEEDDTLYFSLRVFDDDSWFMDSDDKEALGSVSEEIPPASWLAWLDHSVSARKESTNGRGIIAYTLEVLPAITDDVSRRPPLRYSTRDLPPLVFNIDSLCLHKANCFCIDRMLEENKVPTYLFDYELTTEGMIKLGERVADPKLATRLASGKAHRCGHCFLVA